MVLLIQSRIHRRIAVNSPLHYKAPHYAEKPIAIVKTVLHQLVQPRGTVRRPIGMNFHHERAARRVEIDLINGRRSAGGLLLLFDR